MLADSILEGLNPEQRRAVETTEGPLLVVAGAGSGKTRVLTSRVAYLIGVCGIPAESILGVTFTNKAAGEMRERVEKLLGPSAKGLWLSTFHSMCVRILRRDIGALERSRGFVIYDDADSLGISKQVVKRHGLDPRQYEPKKLRWRIDEWKNQGLLPAAAAAQAKDIDDKLTAELYATYQRLLFDANALDFGDLLLQTVELFKRAPQVLEYYQRRWQYILVDEYQDTNRVQYDLVRMLAAVHKNLCCVGDADQCLPPGTLIETPKGRRPVSQMRDGDEVIGATGWGEGGVAKVEKVMSRPHEGQLLRIRTKSGHVLEATPNHMCFARLDPVEGQHYVYLMWKAGVGYRVGTTSGVRASKDRELINGIMVRTNQEVADATWILHSCRDLAEARFHENRISVTYGIPTLVFHVSGRRMAMNPEWVDRLFEEVDTVSGAELLMADLELDIRFPHHRPFAVTRGDISRRYVWFTMFGENRTYGTRAWRAHRVQLVTSDPELRERAARAFKVREGKAGTWRIETSRKTYDAGLELAEQICALDDLVLVPRARLTPGKAFQLMPASHLRQGMTIPVRGDAGVEEDVIEEVEAVRYSGEVYDLSIPDLRNFCANGVFVHNSIYAWRGADIRNILDFEEDYPDAKVVKLERNYRSTQPILSAATAVVENNIGRKKKSMFTEREGGDLVRFYEADSEREEASFVIGHILHGTRNEGRARGEYAILYRTNSQSRSFEEELLKYDIPYVVVGGVRFYQRAEIKDVLCYLRLLVNPEDAQALRRIVNKPARGIGKTTIDRAEELAVQQEISLREGLRRFADDGATKRTATKIREFLDILHDLLRFADRPVDEIIGEVLERSGYMKALVMEDNPEAEARVDNLRELVSSAEDFHSVNAETLDADGSEARSELELYLDQVALISDVDGYDSKAEAVSLMTVHSAKGLEYSVVFLVGMEEGVFPHASSSYDDDGLEEERRLCYVGMTRAMEQLFMTCARERRRFGSNSYQSPSRFLREVPETLMDVQASPTQPRRARGGSGARRRAPSRESGHLDRSYSQETHDDGDGIQRGMRVRHSVFGLGTIEAVIGEGLNQKLKIKFDRAGIKTVMVRYANLELA